MARIACLHSVENYRATETPLTGWDKVPFGFGLVASCLERANHEIRCWVVCPETSLDRVAHEIVDEFQCEMAAATAVSTQFPLIAQLCQQIKALRPSIPILLGGVHASVRPEECLHDPSIDAVCVGEGEDVAVAWANTLARGAQPSGIVGLWTKAPGRSEVERTPPAPFREDLDELPLLNYRHWERWVDPEDCSLRVVIGRGCPYSCTYCSNHAIRRVQTGRYVRFRSPGNVLSEIRMLTERFPNANSIYLEIETIGASIPWALQLCESLALFNAERKQPIRFRANLAVTTQLVRQEERLREFLAACRRANLRSLNVGLESGSERVRRDILRRPPYTNADMIRFCSLAREYGISVALYLLVGVPTETPAEAVQTSEVARACDPANIDESIFYPYPATRLHEISAELRLMDPDHLPVMAERSRVYLKLKDFPRWRVFLEYVGMTWRIFHGRRKTTWVVRKMLSKTCGFVPNLRIHLLRMKDALVHRRPPRSRASAPPVA